MIRRTGGHTTALTITDGGSQNGLEYGPRVVEIAVLSNDGETLAYRYSDDSIDEDWQIGTVDEVVETWAEAAR